MSYGGFYRNIYKNKNKWWVVRNGEWLLECDTLADALYERDRMVQAEWNWENYVHMPVTPNGYKHITLPPFGHDASYITHINEYWTVLSRGRNPRYYGNYHTIDEAEKVRRIYNGRMIHSREKWRVQRKMDGKLKYYGTYDTRDKAEERVKELEEKGWNND